VSAREGGIISDGRNLFLIVYSHLYIALNPVVPKEAMDTLFLCELATTLASRVED
jgi:hypothetical protein